MQTLLLNAFSLNMLGSLPAQISVEEISRDEARRLLAAEFSSAVGHADTAAVFSGELGLDVLPNRVTVSLEPGCLAVVGQYRGPRLPEGAKTLPEGAVIQWFRVTL